MNNNIYNPENIEAYLENKLSPLERIKFESEIKKDPLLESELTLQKDIVESLKNHRKSQLKNRLSNIEVSMTPSYWEIGAKIAASVVISGLVSFGVYTYFSGNSKDAATTNGSIVNTEVNSNITNKEANNNSNSSIATNSSNTAITPETVATVDSEVKNEAPQQNNTIANNKTVNNSSNNNQASKNTGKKSGSKTSKTTDNFNKRTAPVIEENFDDNSFQAEENITVPKGQIAQTTDNKSSVNVSIDGTTDKKFHYKYFSNKLFLYGNFDASTYEILELNTYTNKAVYLLYNNKYYKINANQLEVAPLIQITDGKTINDLKKLNK